MRLGVSGSYSNATATAGFDRIPARYIVELSTPTTFGVSAGGTVAANGSTTTGASNVVIRQLPTTAGVGTGGGGSGDFAGLTDTDVAGIAAGAMLYYDGSDWVDVGIGGVGQRLAVNSAGDAPEWVTDSAQVVGEYLQDVTVSNTAVLPASLSPVNFENFAEPIDTGGIVSYNATTDEYTVTAGSNPVRGEAIIQTIGTGNHTANLFFRDVVDGTGTLFGDGAKRGAAQRGNYGQASGNQAALVYVPAGTTVTLNLMHQTSASSQRVQQGSYVHFRELVTGASGGGGGSSDFDGLTDTDVTGVAAGAMLYYDGSDWVDVGIGTAGQQLVVNAGATAPEWASGSATEDVEELVFSTNNALNGGAFTFGSYADVTALQTAGFTRLRIQTQGLTASTNVEGGSTFVDLADIVANQRIAYHETDTAGFIIVLMDNGSLSGGTFIVNGYTGNTVKIYAVKAQKTVINSDDVVVNDQTASGYMDIGGVRYQWGSGTANAGTTSFPAAFANTNYAVTTTATSGGNGQLTHVLAGTKTTTGFDARGIDVNGSFQNHSFDWIAIGQKP